MNRAALLIAFLTTIPAFGEDPPSREALLGSWHAQDVASGDSWVLKSDGSILTLVRSEHETVTLQAACKTDGTECEGKDDNKKAKFSMYFNGRKLVVLETRDSGVIRRLFSVEGAGDLMTVEVQPVTGPGKQETLHLTRALRA